MIGFFRRCLVLCGFLVISVHGQCYIEIDDFPPLFFKEYGSRKKALPHQSTIYLQRGEEVSAYCATYITTHWNPGNYNVMNVRSVDLMCDEKEEMFYKTPRDAEFVNFNNGDKIHIGCSVQSKQMSASGQCTIEIDNFPPLFVKEYGFRNIVLQNQSSPITIKTGETISAYCSKKLTLRPDWKFDLFDNINVRRVDLFCGSDGSGYYKTPKDPNLVHFGNMAEFKIGCSEKSNQLLYASERALPNCEPHMTYAIGVAFTDEDQIMTARVCYNLDALRLKFVNYLAYPPKYDPLVSKPSSADLRTVSLDKELANLDSFYKFMSESNFVEAYDRKKLDYPLLDLHDFNYESLIQDAPLRGDLKNFENMLNTVWWRNLRLGNWANYLKALHARSSNVSYSVITGTSGVIWMPTSSCNKGETLSVAHGEITVSAPEYIWSYLKALSGNVSEEFVIVGENSPFYYNEPETMLCKDLCEDIDWLRESLFGRLRSMPSMGRMVCCRPEDVAHKLDNFPLEVKPKPILVEQSEPNSAVNYEEETTQVP